MFPSPALPLLSLLPPPLRAHWPAHDTIGPSLGIPGPLRQSPAEKGKFRALGRKGMEGRGVRYGA
eukprot:1052475-Pyramimonas_sp.AAC.1